jgi:hypothetical protein
LSNNDPLARFIGSNLTQTISSLERRVRGLTLDDCANFLESAGAGREAVAAAAAMKRIAGQINVTIHALGILLCLPHILEPGERVEYVSLGAGNAGRAFDLKTNLRIAEFKFIKWRGNADTIRENSVFKDFYLLEQAPNHHRKYLYLLGTKHALKFLRGGRALSSVMSRNEKLKRNFEERFGSTYRTVGEYFAAHANKVVIKDVTPWLSELEGMGLSVEAK